MTSIPGISSEKLKLSGEVLGGSSRAASKDWSDPAIKTPNPELQLTVLPVVPVVRSDGSGTTYALTSYLAKVSPQFRTSVGVTSTLSPPGGQRGKNLFGDRQARA